MFVFTLNKKNRPVVVCYETDRVLPINRSDAISFDQKNQMKTSGFYDE
jgi:hypothetical protein